MTTTTGAIGPGRGSSPARRRKCTTGELLQIRPAGPLGLAMHHETAEGQSADGRTQLVVGITKGRGFEHARTTPFCVQTLLSKTLGSCNNNKRRKVFVDNKSHGLLDRWDPAATGDEYHGPAAGTTSARRSTIGQAFDHARETTGRAWRRPWKQWHCLAVPLGSLPRAGTTAGHARSLGKRTSPATWRAMRRHSTKGHNRHRGVPQGTQ